MQRPQLMTLKTLIKACSSLRLTVVLLAFSMALVFFSTLEQVHLGIHEVQSRYFAQWITWMPLPHLGTPDGWLHSIKLPLLGGYTLGVGLLVNLLAAFPRVFKWRLKKLGIALIHGGIITLIISGFISALLQEEGQLWIPLNGEGHYSESTYDNELVLIDESAENFDTIYALPEARLKTGLTVTDDSLPLHFHIKAFYPNAAIGRIADNPDAPQGLADQGAALKMGLTAFPQPLTYKEAERNAATAYVQILSKEGEDLGTWLVSNIIDERFPRQRFSHEGHTYSLALRFKRTYLPITLKLTAFTHTTYPGTDIPKSFMSTLELIEPTGASRRVDIRMNEPLRTHGFTFYQASFAPGETATMLQVVRNPGWIGPYAGVILVALGLFIHFGLSLGRFLGSRK